MCLYECVGVGGSEMRRTRPDLVGADVPQQGGRRDGRPQKDRQQVV